MMKAGTYYVGDLCYVMGDKWDEVLGKMYPGKQYDECCEGEHRLDDGTKFAFFSTAHGDGSYQDQQGRRYSVDAGIIGCVLWENITDKSEAEDIVTRRHGNKITFAKDFYVSYDDDSCGLISIGDVKIETDPEEEDYWDDEEEENY